MLVGNCQDNIQVLRIWVSAGRMSSRHSSKRKVVMVSKAQEVSLDFFVAFNCIIIVFNYIYH